MADDYVVILPDLSSKRDLWVRTITPRVWEQLGRQGRHSASTYRYEVDFHIHEGNRRPARDLDNYVKKVIDAVTRSGLLWHDDDQIDTLLIRRTRARTRPSSSVEIRVRQVDGQHSGVPSFFRARCLEAQAQPGRTYSEAGYHLAVHLHSQQPYDLDESTWEKEVVRLCGYLDERATPDARNWFWEHFPKCMELVPKRRMRQFVEGVVRAYELGKLGE